MAALDGGLFQRLNKGVDKRDRFMTGTLTGKSDGGMERKLTIKDILRLL